MKKSNLFQSTNLRYSIIVVVLLIVFVATACNQKNPKGAVPPVEMKSQNAVRLIKPTTGKEGKIIHLKNGCGYNSLPLQADLKIEAPTYRAMDEIKNILSYTGIPMSFKVYSADVQYAIATIIDGERFIVYDEKLLDVTDTRSASYWTSMSIIAHEIGHHLAGHTLKPSGNQLDAELEADKFSGFVLYRMGATQKEATHAIRLIANKAPSDTHPGRTTRIQAVEEGWNSADALRNKSAIPPIPKDLDWLEKGSDEYETYHFIFSSDEYSNRYMNYFGHDSAKVTYRQYRANSGAGYQVSPKLYGIVIEKPDTSLGVSIYVTGKPSKLKKDISRDLHQTIFLKYDFDGNAAEFSISEESILVPGRKIEFAYDTRDTAAYKRMIYLKYLPGSAKIDQ